MQNSIALYIHWPFCLSKCPYCDFNSHVRESIEPLDWHKAMLIELERELADVSSREISSIFFGGGTPSLMDAKLVEKLIEKAEKLNGFSDNIEITLEANPTSAEYNKFIDFKSAGVNRVSMGIQSLNPESLKFLGRKHSAEDAIKAFGYAKKIFDRYSFDMIYALPNQTLKDWELELKQALEVADNAGHMSLYQLTIEENTNFYQLHKAGRLILPEDEIAEDMYMQTLEIMSSKGLEMYEISNFAKQGEESRHNLTYWQYGDYVGVGAGAHGRFKNKANGRKVATRAFRLPEKWLSEALSNGSAREVFDEISPEDSFIEGLLMGLRLSEGIKISKLEHESGAKFVDNINMQNLYSLIEEGFLSYKENDYLKATPNGFLILNEIIRKIIA